MAGNEAQDHWENLVLTELGDTSKHVTDLTQSQHMNLHIRQRIAGAAAGTLRKYLQHETFWSEWALECGINPGQLALADMADSLHGSPSRSFPRENKFSLRCHPKLEVCQTQGASRLAHNRPKFPLVTGYLMGAALPRPR